MKLRFGTILALCFVTMTLMSSCVHDYICQCTVSYSGAPGLPDTTTKEYNISDTKKKAKKTCEDNSTIYDKDGIHTEENCHLY